MSILNRLIRALLIIAFSVLAVRCFSIQRNTVLFDRRLESPGWLNQNSNDFSHIKAYGDLTSVRRKKPFAISVVSGRMNSNNSQSVHYNPNKFSATYVLLLANIVAYLFTHNNPWRMQKYIKNNYRIAKGDWYRLGTALFLHGNLPHIAMNSLSLYNIGPQVESIFGPWKFFCLYLGSGVMANFVTYLFNKSPFSLGASGSTYGLLGAYAGFVYTNQHIFGRGSKYVLDSMKRNIAINIMYGFMQSSTDNWAHIGGLAAGAILSFVLSPDGLKRNGR